MKKCSDKRTTADSGRRASRALRLTQRVDHADPTDVQLQEGVVDRLPALEVHEEVVDHRAQLGRQAGQEVDHAQPGDADLRPGDVERQQHQEANQRDAWRQRNVSLHNKTDVRKDKYSIISRQLLPDVHPGMTEGTQRL